MAPSGSSPLFTAKSHKVPLVAPVTVTLIVLSYVSTPPPAGKVYVFVLYLYSTRMLAPLVGAVAKRTVGRGSPSSLTV